MPDIERDRLALRRQTHDINDDLATLADRLAGIDANAARAVQRARTELFEAWTILCVPPDDEDDH